MAYETESNVIVELTDDGLFMAYVNGRTSSYALGETEDEARDNLLERYDLEPDNWSDADEYSYLYAALG